MLREIDRDLDLRQLDRALARAREYYETYKDLSPSELLLLSISFSATIERAANVDQEENKIAHELWERASRRMNKSIEEEAADCGIRLAEIYLSRREIDLGRDALLNIKELVRFGANTLRYNRAVYAYVELTGRSRTDLWID